MKRSDLAGKDKARIPGYTLLDLLAVIAVIAGLVALLLPSLSRGKSKAQAIQCMNCHRQLTLAWHMYSEDNRELLLCASGKTNTPDPGVWMSGTMDFDPGNRSNWDPSVDIYQSPMWPYCGKNPAIFKCPADRSYVVVNGRNVSRVRTMAMNLYLGGFDGSGYGLFDDTAWQVYKKYSELSAPGPEKVFVFADEREDAINWGSFYTDMSGYPTLATAGNTAAYMLADMPGTYHGDACGFSFADNHVELKKWRDPRTRPPLKTGSLIFDRHRETPSPGNLDVAWLQDHSTRPLK